MSHTSKTEHKLAQIGLELVKLRQILKIMAQEVQDILTDAAAVSTALTNIATGIKALDDLITQLQATPGPVTQADLDSIQTAVKGLRTQAESVSTVAPVFQPTKPTP